VTVPIYGIADLHLPGFAGWALNGSTPADPWAAIQQRWKEQVSPDAVVLMPGDICHHDHAPQAHAAYQQVAQLPGATKVITAGNHDWPTASTPKQLKQTAQAPTITALLGSAARFELPNDKAIVVAATCGAWPTMNGGGKHRPCYHKELRRMESALENAGRLMQPGDALIVMTHYPPHSHGRRPTSMTRLIESSDAQLAVYGHVHNRRGWTRMFQGRRGGTEYRFVAADYLHLTPRLLAEMRPRGLKIVS